MSICLYLFSSCTKKTYGIATKVKYDIPALVSEADEYLTMEVKTITSSIAPNSEGGKHDYFSEGPYWWPDPENPNGPYIRKDGQRNPNVFQGHERALKKFEQAVTSLTAAYILTKEQKYANKVNQHLKAWFIDNATRMNPHMKYAQAIKGINSGRGIGIIDAICFIKVTNAILALEKHDQITLEDSKSYRAWFDELVTWYTTHQYGIDEMNNNNNHSTWWGAQVIAYSKFTGNKTTQKIAVDQFRKQLEIQMVADGGFPDELGRTKPFHYTDYNLEAWSIYGLIGNELKENLWQHESTKGTIKKAFDFAYKFYLNPESWPYKTEVEKEIHPTAQDFFYIAGQQLNEKKYLELWEKHLVNTMIASPNLVVIKYVYNI